MSEFPTRFVNAVIDALESGKVIRQDGDEHIHIAHPTSRFVFLCGKPLSDERLVVTTAVEPTCPDCIQRFANIKVNIDRYKLSSRYIKE